MSADPRPHGGPDDASPVTRASRDEHPGELIRIGPYRLVQRLGEGGMGVVHLALDRHGRAVAVKVLKAHIAHDPDARARLAREVASLSRVQHPRVAPVVDADVDGDTPYIVTRYVPGPPLDAHVDERGPLPPADLHRVAEGLAEALDVIHSAGVVHRDVKPGNVLLVDGDPVLIDFGIAHVADDVRLTMTGLVMGTPGYLAPEVVAGDDVTPATDWWGWAATTVFAASGAPPFGRGQMSAVLARVSAGEPDLGAVDPRIEPLLWAALSPNPDERPYRHEVLAALEQYARGVPVTAAIEVRRSRPATQQLATPATTALPPPPTAAPGPPPAPGPEAVRAGPGSDAAPPPVAPLLAGPPVTAPTAGMPPPPAPPPPVPPPAALPADPQSIRRPTGPPGWEQAQSAPPDRWLPGPGVPPSGGPDGGAPTGGPSSVLPPGDPRIGRPARSGSLLALLAALAGLAAAAPLVAVVALAGWMTAARTADRSVTSLVLRRYARGPRGSDIAVAMASSPWHAMVGLAGSAVTVVLPLVVGGCAMVSAALVVSSVAGTSPVRPDGAVPLMAGGAFAALTAWWGPGGASLRRGSRSLVRGVTAHEVVRQILVGVVLVVAVSFLAVAVTRGGPSWWPSSVTPSWVVDRVRAR
ncbi:MAG: serine/threonine-protein kinase [Dermatophilaceae bacterium]